MVGSKRLDGVRRICRDGTSEIPGLMDGWYIGSPSLGWHGPFMGNPLDRLNATPAPAAEWRT